MDGLISFLLYAVIFYFMMRFGCGAHMVHGGHHGKGHDGSGAKDVVCGMDVAANQGYTKMYDGRKYNFCSRNCLDKFEAEPQRYVS